MKNITRLKWTVSLVIIAILSLPSTVMADENLALYGLKGYAYTYSPLVVDGLHLQTGVMYSSFHGDNLFRDDNLNCRDGNIWAVPLSLTYGDGDWWEVSAATHWERWENTDFDVNENGIGDVFLGGKVRILRQDKGSFVDVSVMPYALISTGDRDKSVGDLYRYSASDEDDPSYGGNLLLGKRWDRFYLTGNVGLHYVDTDEDDNEDEDADNTTLFIGLTAEYQVSETVTTYAEFINKEHSNTTVYPESSPCYDEDSDEDIRELGIGVAWLKDQWGFKIHAGAGLTPTSPDVRVAALINLSF
ncbi:DUF5777 family beta-barrel protein [Desulfonema magnum]|uniref:DUF5777 domain-containing protein n=1 Tax=Desulfonema magnum TaxID=45655 RepID=A0A975BP49_9BACT|nr:DUF5777 family beta-barrel protein [Desulfonema magnum]QTA88847.1 Uncharacterized protein dnm_048940 [Desulfonema magnum]